MTLSCRIRVLKALKSPLSQSLSLSKFPLITLLLITNSIATPPANAPEEHSHHSHQIVIRSRQPHLYCTVLFCNLYSSPTGVDSVCLSVCLLLRRATTEFSHLLHLFRYDRPTLHSELRVCVPAFTPIIIDH